MARYRLDRDSVQTAGGTRSDNTMRGLLVLLACVPALAVGISGNGAWSCGRAGAGPLAQNGEPVPIETVPWHAAIFKEQDGTYKNVCGGTLVSPCVVVTAANCVDKNPKIFVALGKHLSDWDSKSKENIHTVKNSTVHPLYLGDAGKLAYDIAVLELEECSPITDKIVPICMDKNIRPVSSSNVKIAGWGNETSVLPELRSTTLKQLSHDDCWKVMSTKRREVAYVTHDKFCATAQTGVDESRLRLGDSGGGGVVWKDGIWYITGVVDARLKSANNQEIYTLVNISEYVDWVQEFIRHAVAGVQKTPIETVPWHAGIFTADDKKKGEKKFVCGGSLVSPCTVVTTAHCVEKGQIFVALGKYLSSWDSESGNNIHKTPVKNITKHPYFKGLATNQAYDIGVLELEHCIPGNKNIFPICIDKDIQPVSSAEIKVPGWGFDSERAAPMEELRTVTLTQLDYGDCLEAMSESQLIKFITPDKFCATRRPGTPQSAGLVRGDSGGGAVVKHAGSWYLAGVAASLVHTRTKDDIYGFTKISEYVDWIRGFAGAPSESCLRAAGGPVPSVQKAACGRASDGPASLVLSGERTPVETVPWQAGIFVEKDGLLNVCGGTLVSPCVVVTAAHCIPEGRKIFVALGKFLSGWHMESGKNIHKSQVRKVTKHPYFKGHLTKMAFDIAVLELKDCSPINRKISPICMDKNIHPVSSAEIKVAGWGNESTPLVELESVTLTQLNFLDCLNVMSNNAGQAAYITSDKFCATRRKGSPQSGLLMGDSGGAALVKQAGSWYMTGVVSGRLKDENDEDVYALTKVSEYVDWIQTFV